MNADPILDAVFHTWRFQVVATACRLGIFTLLDKGVSRAERLAATTESRPELLEALLDACVAIGLLQRDGETYANSHYSSAHLVKGRPLYLGHILEVQARGAERWNRLLDVVKSGAAPEVTDEFGEQDPLFTLAMNDLGAYNEAAALADAVDLSHCRTLLDVGCGSGLYAIALCRANPQLTATVMDREPVLATTARMISASGLAERIRTRTGDMTSDPFEESVDAVLLSDSLYYDADVSRRILVALHTALNPGGVVIVRGYYSDPTGSESPFGAIFRLNLLLFDPARTPPTATDIARLLSEVGFRDPRSFALTGRSTCFVAIR